MSQNQKRKIIKTTISSLYVLNCFKCFQIYILGHLPQKSVSRKAISSLHVWFSMAKCFNISKLKAYIH